MNTRLRWTVGKFIYQQGGSTALHFMPLRDFHLDDSLDMALVIALRSQRISPNSSVGDLQLSRWMEITAIEQIATMAAAVLTSRPIEERAQAVTEYDPGLGSVLEALRLTLARKRATQELMYTAVGPASIKHLFEVLHGDLPRLRYDVVPDGGLSRPDLTIINHVQAIRRSGFTATQLQPLLARTRGPIVLAARTCAGSSASRRTTIRGIDVQLEPYELTLERCRAQDRHWRYRYVPGHDAGYFLPADDAPDVGLLLAYTAEMPLDLPRFQAL